MPRDTTDTDPDSGVSSEVWLRSRDRCESDMCGVFRAVTDDAFTDVTEHGRNKRPETSAARFTEGLRFD